MNEQSIDDGSFIIILEHVRLVVSAISSSRSNGSEEGDRSNSRHTRTRDHLHDDSMHVCT
jgi:hypothetical protein